MRNCHSQKDCKLVFKTNYRLIRLPFVIKIFALSIFERPFYTGFTVCLLENSKIVSTFQGLRLNDELS